MTPADLVAALVAVAPLFGTAAPDDLGAALGTRFSLASQTPYMDVWQAPGTPPVESWELRLSKPGDRFFGLLSAEIARPGIAESTLDLALAPYATTGFDVVSPPLDGGSDWVEMSSTCYAVPAGQLCVSWEGLDPKHATALTLEVPAPEQ